MEIKCRVTPPNSSGQVYTKRMKGTSRPEYIFSPEESSGMQQRDIRSRNERSKVTIVPQSSSRRKTDCSKGRYLLFLILITQGMILTFRRTIFFYKKQFEPPIKTKNI